MRQLRSPLEEVMRRAPDVFEDSHALTSEPESMLSSRSVSCASSLCMIATFVLQG